MSATPEQIAYRLERFGATFDLDVMKQAAALIKAQSEREKVLVDALRKIADHPTSGIGCNPQSFVEIARAALKAAP